MQSRSGPGKLGPFLLGAQLKILGLDISSHCGWSVLVGEKSEVPQLLEYGLIENDAPTKTFGTYPWFTYYAAKAISERVVQLIDKIKPDAIVIEQINLGRNRFSQQYLERIHSYVLEDYAQLCPEPACRIPIYYIDSSEWRRTIGLRLSKDQKKDNAKLSKAKREAATGGKKLDKSAIGVRGKVTWKHISVGFCNEYFRTDFKLKDNDICDSILLAVAHIKGAAHNHGE